MVCLVSGTRCDRAEAFRSLWDIATHAPQITGRGTIASGGCRHEVKKSILRDVPIGCAFAPYPKRLPKVWARICQVSRPLPVVLELEKLCWRPLVLKDNVVKGFQV